MYDIALELDVKIPMRDGVELSADIYRPRAAGRFPTILLRTPYDNNNDIEKSRTLANRGYVCVAQDCRGRWDSDGDYYPFHPDGEDGFDTQEWIGTQEWSDGKIGMSGSSYLGSVQWLSAMHGSSHLTCMAPRVICADFYQGLVHPGGALQLGVCMTWGMRTNGRTAQNIEYHNWTEALRGLPLTKIDELSGRKMQFWKDWINHSCYDDYWRSIDVEPRFSDIRAPAFNMGGWYDLYARDSFRCFNGLRQHGGSPEAKQSKLIVGPWPHALSTSTKTGDIDFGADSMADLEGMEMRWFNYWLKGIDDGFVNEPPLRLFIMGINQWRNENEWPLARTDWQRYYLHSGGNSNSLLGDGTLNTEIPGKEVSDTFVYDPQNPVQTNGGSNCCSPHIIPWGPYDQRPVEMRSDVLCYTSTPMTTDMEVTGPIRAVLYAATDGLDTDWTAKLVDVSESGYAMNLCDGIIRARFRTGFDRQLLLEPDSIYCYEIEMGVTGNVFRKGHSIRLEISSSNFPRFDRNPNTGAILGNDDKMRTAMQTVYHDTEHASHIVLPIIPKG